MLVFFIAVLPSSPAFACSGPQPTIFGEINDADLIVKGEVVESDDVQTNAIIQVESYISGAPGQQFLLVQYNTPFDIRAHIEGFRGLGDCDGWGHIPTGEEVYFFLKSSDTGVYRIYQKFAFRDTFSTLSLPFPDPNHPDSAVYKSVTETEFLNLIAQIKGGSPQAPRADNNIYPAKSLLVITTTKGIQYYLPVDGSPPVEIAVKELRTENMLESFWPDEPPLQCWLHEDCSELSPNGLKAAVQLDPNTIVLSDDSHHSLSGQAFLFAPTSDHIAIWNDDQLTILPLYYSRLSLYGKREPISLHLNLISTGVEVPSHAGVWSLDGRWFAYSDADGLWLQDVIAADAPPRLLLATAAGQVPTARYFSPQSHYLAFTQGDQQATLDLDSGHQFPDGLVSPDDRTLLAFDLAKDPTDIQICLFETGTCTSNDSNPNFIYLPSSDPNEGIYTPLTQIKRVEWADRYSYFVLACDTDQSDRCGVSEFSYQYGLYDDSSPSVIAGDYAYQPSTGEIAYLVDDHTVIWNNQKRDLSPYIDSAITSIQWLPSEFYTN